MSLDQMLCVLKCFMTSILRQSSEDLVRSVGFLQLTA